MDRGYPACIFMDALSGEDATHLCGKLKSDAFSAIVPVIFLVPPEAGTELILGGLEAGADEVLTERPGVRAYEGKRVIVGIRPENMEDASIMPVIPEDRRMKVDIVLREALGAEVLVHFQIDAPPVLTEDTRELVADLGVSEEELTMTSGLDFLAGGSRAEIESSTFVARLDPRTRAAERRSLELAVDTARMHFFDPDTRLGIYGNGT